jgi:competence protein ComEA
MDAIMMAGGLTDQADTSVINLSKKVTDEMVIIIYSKEEVSNFSKTKETEQVIQKSCQQQDETSLKNDACITSEKTITGKISINNATIEELMTLSGIGEAKAKEIISYREKNGPFQEIQDLLKVPGIGENLFASIQEDITL